MVFFLALTFTAKAQQAPIQDYFYPVQFDQFEQSYSLVNPAFIGQMGNTGLKLGSQFDGNTQGQIATYFSTISFKIKDKDEGNPQFLGVNIYNEQQGPVLNVTRLYAMYGVKVFLNDSLTLTGGVGAGAFNYSVTATSGSVATPARSDLTPDAKGGVWLKGSTFQVGISVNQLFNNQITPFREPLRVERHFNFTAEKEFLLNDNIVISPSAKLRSGPHIEDELFLNFLVKLKSTVTGGLGYQLNRSQIIPKVGFTGLKIAGNRLTTQASYKVQAPGSIGFRNLQVLELTLGYQFQ